MYWCYFVLSIILVFLIVAIIFYSSYHSETFNSNDRRLAFSNIYKHHFWGNEHPNGIGSTENNTQNDIAALQFILQKYKIQSILDCGCGTFSWFRHVLKNFPYIKYTGIDIVPDQIRNNQKANPEYTFFSLDVCTENLPYPSDLIFSKEMTQHLKEKSTIEFLKNCRSKAKYIMLTSFDIQRNSDSLLFTNGNLPDLDKGAYREQNFLLPPYNEFLNKPMDRFYIRESLHGTPQFLQLFQLS